MSNVNQIVFNKHACQYDTRRQNSQCQHISFYTEFNLECSCRIRSFNGNEGALSSSTGRVTLSHVLNDVVNSLSNVNHNKLNYNTQTYSILEYFLTYFKFSWFRLKDRVQIYKN